MMTRIRHILLWTACAAQTTIAGPLLPRHAHTTFARSVNAPTSEAPSVTFVFAGGDTTTVIPGAKSPTSTGNDAPESASISHQVVPSSASESTSMQQNAAEATSTTSSIHFSYSPERTRCEDASNTIAASKESTAMLQRTSMVTLYTTIYPDVEPTAVPSQDGMSSISEVHGTLEETRTATVTMHTTSYAGGSVEASTSSLTIGTSAGVIATQDSSATSTARPSASGSESSDFESLARPTESSSLVFSYSPEATSSSSEAEATNQVSTDQRSSATAIYSYAPESSTSSSPPADAKTTSESSTVHATTTSEASIEVTGLPSIVTPEAPASSTSGAMISSSSSSSLAGITIVPVDPNVSTVTVKETETVARKTVTVVA